MSRLATLETYQREARGVGILRSFSDLVIAPIRDGALRFGASEGGEACVSSAADPHRTYVRLRLDTRWAWSFPMEQMLVIAVESPLLPNQRIGMHTDAR